MKIITLAVLGASALALANCGTTSATITADVAAIEAQVQADANLACGFIPTIATIAGVIPGAGVIIADAATIANTICTAVENAPKPAVASAKLRSMTANVAVNVAKVYVPNVGTVAISGTFTR